MPISFICYGLIGLFISGLWLWKYKCKKIVVVLLLAYIARSSVGIILYINEYDANYFSGNGDYKDTNWEYYYTFNNAVIASNHIQQYHEFSPSKIFEDKFFYKNRDINTWMGIFLWTGHSNNSMDLISFNSFHHVLAGLLIIIISLKLGYNNSIAIKSGVLIAWIPWAFPASLMWRDSVGLCFVILSIYFLIKSLKTQNLFLSIIAFLPVSILFAQSDREIYGIIILLVYLYFRKLKGTTDFNFVSVPRIIFLSIMIIFTNEIFTNLFFYRHSDYLQIFLDKIVIIPLQIIRAIIGPFPWTNINSLYVLFDYLFHILQLAIILLIVINIKRFRSNSLLLLTFALFSITVIFSSGVHTAYIAVGFPLLLPMAFDLGKKITPFIYISIIFFLIMNVIYISLGLHGTGIILNTTGY